jgi:eukaryotic-like serine/threonine-protein kinase
MTASWHLDENIGHGTYGVVFASRREADPPGTHPWAFKRLQTDFAKHPEAVTRFLREVKLLSDMNHPNVIDVVDAGHMQSGIPYMVMPRADGNLKGAIDDGRTSNRTWSLTVFIGVLAGVFHAHQRGVLHRDLKPSNILMFGERPAVSDFGTAKHLDPDATSLTNTVAELGTLSYMAPEQFRDPKTAGTPADVYSLGKVLAHMLSGIKPSFGKVDLTGVPEELKFFVDKCCREDPNTRYADAGEALVAFRSMPLTPYTASEPPPARANTLASAAASGLQTGHQREAISELEAHFRTLPDEVEMYRKELPRVDRRVLTAWIEQSLDGFRDVLAIYDRHVARPLAFEYADVIANFYNHVFWATEDLGVRRIALARLLESGYIHNRFYVNDVVVELLASLSRPAEVAVATEAIDDNQRAAIWYADIALARSLRAPIADALQRAKQAYARCQASTG